MHESVSSAPVAMVPSEDVQQVKLALVETETLIQSMSGLELGKAEQAKEVAPMEDLPAPAEVPSNVVQSVKLTGVSATKLRAGELPLSTDKIGRQSLCKAF